MDVALAEPKPWEGGSQSHQCNWDLSLRPETAANFRGGGWGRRLGVCLLPDGRRLPDPDYLGHYGIGMTFGEDEKKGPCLYDDAYIGTYVYLGRRYSARA